MKVGLIGYTGFVGQSILRTRKVQYCFNRANISEYAGDHFDILIIAAGDARKWYANQNPAEDSDHIDALQVAISKISASRVIQISTVDVLDQKSGDETTMIDPIKCDIYGANRLKLEDFLRQNFKKCSVIRLPGLFGAGLKKNLIFDISQNRSLEGFNPKSTFQWFDMSEINRVIDLTLEHCLDLLHVCAEPLSAGDVATLLHGQVESMRSTAPLVHYDIRTRYSNILPITAPGYLYGADQTINRMRQFLETLKCA